MDAGLLYALATFGKGKLLLVLSARDLIVRPAYFQQKSEGYFLSSCVRLT